MLGLNPRIIEYRKEENTEQPERDAIVYYFINLEKNDSH